MSKIKAGGSAKNVHDSPGQRLGVKVFGGQKVRTGDVIVRQIGMTKRSGKGTFLSKDFKVKLFSGKNVHRTEVTVE
jgi:large subunit ribosomal protein L27